MQNLLIDRSLLTYLMTVSACVFMSSYGLADEPPAAEPPAAEAKVTDPPGLAGHWKCDVCVTCNTASGMQTECFTGEALDPEEACSQAWQLAMAWANSNCTGPKRFSPGEPYEDYNALSSPAESRIAAPASTGSSDGCKQFSNGKRKRSTRQTLGAILLRGL